MFKQALVDAQRREEAERTSGKRHKEKMEDEANSDGEYDYSEAVARGAKQEAEPEAEPEAALSDEEVASVDDDEE